MYPSKDPTALQHSPAEAVLTRSAKQSDRLAVTAAVSRRSSAYISGTDVRKAYNAVAFANRLGAVMNVHLTIVWFTVSQQGDESYAGNLQRYLELFRKWCDERRLPCCWVYSWERGPRNGLHSHVLTSVPRIYQHEFARWAHQAIQTVTGSQAVGSGRGRSTNKEIPSTLRIVHRREGEVHTQWLLFRYLMKGVHPFQNVRSVLDDFKPRALAEILAIKPRQQGKVFGKRVGVSRKIDVAAQIAAGFVSAFDRGAITPATLLTGEYLDEFHRAEKRRELDDLIGRLRI